MRLFILGFKDSNFEVENKIISKNLGSLGWYGLYDRILRLGKTFHTHSAIHEGIFKAANFLKYETYWIEEFPDDFIFNNDDVVILEPRYMDSINHLPKRVKILIHGDKCFFESISSQFDFNAPNVWFFENYLYCKNYLDYDKIADFVYSHKNDRIISMAWATDEFQSDTYFQSLTFKPSPCSFYVGNFSDDALILAYQIKKNLKLINHDLYRVSGVNSLSAKYFLTISRFSFDVRSSQHITDGFIPCRIFKNCSYGRGVITNSEAIHNAFNKLIPIYKDADDFIHVSDKYSCGYFDNQLREASFYIQKNHTYLNRIRDLFHIIGV